MTMLLQLALRNLRQAGSRTVLLGLAIAMVTTLLVLMLSLSNGTRDNLVRSATTTSAGHVVVGGFYKTTPTEAAPILTGAAELRALIEREVTGLDYVVQRHRGWGKVLSDSSALQLGLNGLSMADEHRLFEQLRLAPQAEYVDGGEPRVTGDLARFAQPDAAIIFAEQARQLEVDVGDVLTIQTETAGGRTNTADVTVVAVAEDVGLLSSFAIFLPTPMLLELYALDSDTTGAFWVYLDDPDRSGDVMRQLRLTLIDAGYTVMDHQPAPFWMKFDGVAGEDWVGQKLDLTTWKDEVSFVMSILTAFDTVTWFLGLILVAIVAIGIMNAMWNAVRERTREIGTMRAIGMTRGRVLGLFLAEAALLGLGATLAGALVGVGVAAGVDAAAIEVPDKAVRTILLADTIHLVVAPVTVAAAVVLLSLLTAISATWPALRASRMSPIKALSRAE